MAGARSYRWYLTSALHARFRKLVLIGLGCSLLTASLTNGWPANVWDFAWSIFPLSFTGVKAFLFSLSTASIYLLQIAYLHVGSRCTTSKSASLKAGLTSAGTYWTLLTYLVSAIWFCFILVLSSSSSAKLGFVVSGGYGAPDKLNERPLYLYLFFACLGITQAMRHLRLDKSSITIPVSRPEKPQERAKLVSEEAKQPLWLVARGPAMLYEAGIVAGLTAVITPFLYSAIFRDVLWSLRLPIVQTMYTLPRSELHPHGTFFVGGIIPKAFLFGLLLSLSWQVALILYSAYMIQAPVRDNEPLSNASKDRNGTLLNGLRSRRDIVQTSAIWELDLIAQSFPDRRRAIFADIERPEGPVFLSMLNAALTPLSAIQTRISNLDASVVSTPDQPSLAGELVVSEQDKDVQPLPRILTQTQPAKSSIYQAQNSITARTGTGRAAQFMVNELAALGNSPNAWSPDTQKYKALALQKLQPELEKARKSANEVSRNRYLSYWLKSPSRLVKAVVCGTPHANTALLIKAITSTTRMCISTLQEDVYGKAIQAVPLLVNQFVNSIVLIENFAAKHLGQEVNEKTAKYLEDVVIVHMHLKAALKEMLSAFQMFLGNSVAIRDLNAAHAACRGKPLFKVVKPKQRNQITPQEPRREMEEVKHKEDQHDQRNRENNARAADSKDTRDGRNDKDRENARPPAFRRKSQQQVEAENQADKARPGRIFRQLDKDYISDGQSQPQAQPQSLRSYSTREDQRQKDHDQGKSQSMRQISSGSNVFGARDTGGGPGASGLTRHREAMVR